MLRMLPIAAMMTGLLVALLARGSTAADRGASSFGDFMALHDSSSVFHERVLYSFQNRPDGERPTAGLIADSTGALYGTTELGGFKGARGTVFKLTPSGNSYVETVLYRFLGGSDGANPFASLIADSTGALYGTTEIGGSTNLGTVFKLTPNENGYTESVLYTFQGADGSFPLASLIADSTGALYGTTNGGGANNLGTVFKLTPGGNGYTETVLYSFQGGVDGANPHASVLADSTGALYGTTWAGGAKGLGTAFKLTLNGGSYSESILYSFGRRGFGANPADALIADSSGSLYGTTVGTRSSFGTAYKLTPDQNGYSLKVLHVFNSGLDGVSPASGLIADSAGSLYGTTAAGGSHEMGIVFRLRLNGTGYRESVLYNFGSRHDDANSPQASLISDSTGALYGTTVEGGTGGQGTVFKVSP